MVDTTKARKAIGGFFAKRLESKTENCALTNKSTLKPEGDARTMRMLALFLLIVFVVTGGASLLFLQSLSGHDAFITFFPLVMLAALCGGFRVGMLSMIAVIAAVDYFFVEPTRSFEISSADDRLSLIVFLIGCIAASWFVREMRRADEKLRREETERREELERLVCERTAELTHEIGIRKNIEEALIKALNDVARHKVALTAILDVAPVAICIARDPACDVLFINKKAETLFCATKGPDGELRRLSDLSCRLVAEDFKEIPQSQLPMQQAATGESVNGREYCVLYKDGTHRHCLVNAEPLRDEQGNVTGAVAAYLDITDRKRIEQKLRVSRLQLETFVRHAPVSMAMFDQSMTYLACSDCWIKQNGQGHPDLIGSNYCELHPNLPDYWKNIYQRGLSGETLENDDDVWMEGGGAEQALRWAVVPWANEDGEVGGIIVYTEDISERKRSEEALRESEARARMLEETLTQGVIYRDSAGKILRANPAARRILGRSSEELVNHGLEDLKYNPICEDGSPFPIDNHPALVALRTGQIVSKVVLGVQNLKTNEVCWIIVDAVPLFHPWKKEPYQVYTIFTDITHLKEAEQALRESEARARLMENTVMQGIIYRNAEGKVIRANPAAETILGYSAKELKEATCDEINDKYIREDGSPFPVDEQPVMQALREGRKVTNVVLGHHNPKLNMYRWLMVDAVPLFRPGETRPYEAYSIFTDKTDIIEGTKALALAKAEAERANLAKSKFLASASHDLRQPVQSLALLLSAIDLHVVKKPRAARTVDMMKTAVDNLSSLLNGILDISRLDAGLIVPVRDRLELGSYISNLMRDYTHAAASKGLKLRVWPTTQVAWTDPSLLDRIMRNFIENALRYTPQGGIAIGCRTRGEYIRVDVVDTGIGIPADKKDRIFEEFYQVRAAAHQGEQGMGLGLSIVSRIAGILGVEIEVSSNFGRGSRFSIYLPACESAAPPRREEPEIEEDPGGRILVIEDNAVLREGFKLAMEAWGYRAFSASSAEEALDIGKKCKWQFDAVVSDYRLGKGLNGLEAVKEIERLAGRSVPAIIITGDTVAEKCVEAQASGHVVLHKPVRAEDLRVNIARLLKAEGEVAAEA